MIRVEPATPAHMELFKLELTPADDLEAQACGCANACTAFSYLLETSLEAWAAVMYEAGPRRVGCMLGVRPREDGAQLWFHSTELFASYPLAFVKPARKVFDAMLERHPVLHGLINPDSPGMIRLATWLGFELGAVEQHGAFRFHPAILRRK